MKTIINYFLFMVILFAMSTTLFAQSLVSIDPDNALEGQGLGVGISGLNTQKVRMRPSVRPSSPVHLCFCEHGDQ